MKCNTCDSDPCANPSFCRACRRADAFRWRGFEPRFDKPIGQYGAAELKAVIEKMSPMERAAAEHDERIKWMTSS